MSMFNDISCDRKDNVLIGPGIFPYIYHVGSNFNLKSIVSNGLIPVGQDLSKRQSVFFLPVDPRNEDHREPENIDYSVPRPCPIFAKHLEETSRHGAFGSILILESSKKD